MTLVEQPQDEMAEEEKGEELISYIDDVIEHAETVDAMVHEEKAFGETQRSFHGMLTCCAVYRLCFPP